MPGEGSVKDRKLKYFETLKGYLEDYDQLFIVTVDNVGSNQMQQIRHALRGKAVVLMGKNTMMKKVIRQLLSQNPKLEAMMNQIYGNIGFVFCRDNLAEVRSIIQEKRVPAAARAGAIAPCDVKVPKGNTGLEPTQTSFLQALNIPSKISRGQIEILSDVDLIHCGAKVGQSEAALLVKLGIKPFSYGLELRSVYDKGYVYDPSVFDVSDDELVEKFTRSVSDIAAFSLGVSYPTLVALPHAFIDAYRGLVGVALEADYTFPAMQEIKDLLSDPEKLAAMQAAAAAPTETKEETKEEAPKAEESEEESDDDMGLGLFD